MFDSLSPLVSRLQLLELQVHNALQPLSHLHQARPASFPDGPASQKSRQTSLGLSGDQGFLGLQMI